MPFNIDESTEFGARVRQRLIEERFVWLTTVSPGGTPLPSLVWFLHDEDETVLVWSQPAKPKVKAIAVNPTVALNFNSDTGGDNMVVLKGTAAVDTSNRPEDQRAAFVEKYGRAMTSIGYRPPERFFDDYSVPIRVSLETVRGF